MNKPVIFLLIFLSIISVSSCKKDPSVDFAITSPKSNWTYYEDTPVVFSSNLNSENLIWTSSIDGRIGTGSGFSKILSYGKHTITLEYEITGASKTVQIEVQEKASKTIKLLQESGNTYSKTSDRSSLGLFSLEGKIDGLQITFETDSINPASVNKQCLELKRDVVIQNDGITSIIKKSSLRNAVALVPESRAFKVINTITQADCHEISANLIDTTDNFYVYADSSLSDDDISTIKNCVAKFEKNCFYKVLSIWGDCEDINGDGKFTLLFAPCINDEGIAVGFFNQNDFFAADDDENPFSNEMDICYVAVPDESKSSYCFNSIIATLAHEITHAINFSKKTYAKVKLNSEDNAIMETFLDEGLCHLTESLCGYGVTGGNMNFVNHYLSKSPYYSFCSTDINGSSDSVYQRGAMALFLYYLFCQEGGMDYNADNSIKDEGGISFLNRIISSEYYDWKAIGEAAGTNTDYLFREFCTKLLTNSMEDIFDFSKTDPVTDEKIFKCDELSIFSSSDISKLLEYSIMKIESESSNSTITWNEISGNCYLVW